MSGLVRYWNSKMQCWREAYIMHKVKQDWRQKITAELKEDANSPSFNPFLFDLLPMPPPSSPSGSFSSLHLWVTSVWLWRVSGSEVLMQLLSGELRFDIHELPIISPFLTSYLFFLQRLSSLTYLTLSIVFFLLLTFLLFPFFTFVTYFSPSVSS